MPIRCGVKGCGGELIGCTDPALPLNKCTKCGWVGFIFTKCVFNATPNTLALDSNDKRLSIGSGSFSLDRLDKAFLPIRRELGLIRRPIPNKYLTPYILEGYGRRYAKKLGWSALTKELDDGSTSSGESGS